MNTSIYISMLELYFYRYVSHIFKFFKYLMMDIFTQMCTVYRWVPLKPYSGSAGFPLSPDFKSTLKMNDIVS